MIWLALIDEEGRSNAQEAEMLERLVPGEIVIRYPANQIDDGVRVKAK